MARKNLLAGLTDFELPAGNSSKDALASAADETVVDRHPRTFGQSGAIGAVTRSIEQLKSQIGEAKNLQLQLAAGHTVVEIDPTLVERSFVVDRMARTLEEDSAFAENIRDQGQLVPILVRPHPTTSGRFQVAYGHRRLRAAATLGVKVRAVVKELSDVELVVAQGQENSARTDLSFIERAAFAARLEQAGFDRETIMAALSIDKTALSKLISVAIKIPEHVLTAVGPAPKTGRDRWLALSERLGAKAAQKTVRELLQEPEFLTLESDKRFLRLFNALAPKPQRVGRPAVWTGCDGKKVGRIQQDDRELILTIDKRVAPEFAAYLIDKLSALYQEFSSASDETNDQ
jgi:ParB family chromosome partitioning protein